ncbi:hypothetical protein [Frigoriglobus tundricola]|uniref:Carboxypeptidase regulatory-like domain-containing protein n=1 Tax=Frigoriglobus tundricola TaxID=2774151 RepID=A0A6M5YKY1_9BACT|nr:hypothetical protein [Frigoriglobus tundricola]QJW94234.1 hypothetical protein FTUN_1754 [Frigoriglobus tundricola]
MRWVRCGGMAALVAAVGLTVGCGGGGSGAEVSGTVAYEGKPVEDGAITFFLADGKGATGGTIKGGKYTATKVPIGNVKVTITGKKVVGKKKAYNTPDSPEVEQTAELLPPKYSAKDKTELTFEVKTGANEKNWDLAK